MNLITTLEQEHVPQALDIIKACLTHEADDSAKGKYEKARMGLGVLRFYSSVRATRVREQHIVLAVAKLAQLSGQPLRDVVGQIVELPALPAGPEA